MAAPTVFPNETLLEVRQDFIRLTKRYDLVTNGDITAADNGANRFINMGQMYLDSIVEHPLLLRKWKGVLDTTKFFILVKGLIRVEFLYLLDSTNGYYALTGDLEYYDEFRWNQPNLYASYTSGRPTTWTFGTIELAPEFEQQKATITGATAASPVVITSSNTFSDGDFVVLQNVLGMTELNENVYKVASSSGSGFSLTDEDDANIDGSAFTAYTSGGITSLVPDKTAYYNDTVFENYDAQEGIIFNRASDQRYQVELIGKFYSRQLSANGDKTFWTVRYPLLLAQAAARMHAKITSNRQAIAYWEDAMRDGFDEIDIQDVERSMTGRIQRIDR